MLCLLNYTYIRYPNQINLCNDIKIELTRKRLSAEVKIKHYLNKISPVGFFLETICRTYFTFID